ncbi:Tripartite tricarboxylate transporter family receptor [Pigmentiphaga humi]|uniref:Tripartite tricarboxylate transporter family receptor n=1 Tax=Pigmentiphaga humi TaxID=2478468 RepID=A0A3P4B6F2_9BURK|nr:tripartite tricarboxylate transporter substrate binding protein [Pigmentiphaga humi]VCU71869.1 Tripartite tricarboxylate transporter family receptor [Pigmentiphaga humi]
MFRDTIRSCAIAAVFMAPSLLQAQTNWPTRPITLVVPFAPGGVADKIARPVAEALQTSLGKPVVVENRVGAGGGIGMAHVANSAPDGYTLLLALNSISVIPEADKIMNRKPMYSMNQFEGIARFTAETVVLVVNANSKWRSVADFVKTGGEREISYASSGTYGTQHIFMEALRQQADLKMVHVPYTGAAPATMALLGGQVEALVTSPASVVEHVKAGKLRVLAHYGTAPVDVFPDVPSLIASGYNVQFPQWAGLFAPKGIPDNVRQRLRTAAREAAQSSRVKELVLAAGSEIAFLDGPEFQKYWAEDASMLTATVQKIGRID